MSDVGSRRRPRLREAGRVVLLDGRDRVLLLKGTEPRRPQQSWWITPGGGLAPGESHRDGAARETTEETGYVVELATHPCLEREVEFPFDGAWYRQHELFYPARLEKPGAVDAAAPLATAWTDMERRTLLDVRWWTLAQLRGSEEVVYPVDLAELVERLLREGWR